MDGLLALLFFLASCLIVVLGNRLRKSGRRIEDLIRVVGTTADGVGSPLMEAGPSALGGLERQLVERVASLRRRLEDALARERRLGAVLGGMVEGVLLLDHAGIVLLSNRRAEMIFGLPAEEGQLGRPLIELNRHPDLLDLVRDLAQTKGPSEPMMREITLDAAGQHVLRVTATPIDFASGRPRDYILVFHDISELKHLERIRRDFVANVSHELRTPLAAIGGYTETLLGGALEDSTRARRFLGIIERHTERLGRLVSDLLTLSDLELGRTKLRRASVEAARIIEVTFETLRQRADPAGIILEQRVEEGTPALDADEDRLEQALINLVDNSIKYTGPGGRVVVSARRLPATEDARSDGVPHEGSLVEITVSDTGIGVPPEELPRLTERFYRVDKARSREVGGTGLGLAIVKHIVQAHGGSMRIESKVNEGTTVRLILPAVEKERPEAAPARGVAS